jgi:beta-galactosidase GanA
MTLEYTEIMESDNSRFGKILSEMMDTYKKKNADYGNSFSETIQEFGYIPAVARINDKLKRVKNMVKGQEMNIKDESLRDNLMDIANYCVLTIMELDNQDYGIG